MEDFDEADLRLAKYIEMGVVEIAGVDESGEMIFAINESAKELAPELWESHIEYVDRTLLDFYEKGLITVSYNEDLEAEISISEEGMKLAKEAGLLPMEFPEIPND